MGTTAVVQSFERTVDDDGNGSDVKVEVAGEDFVDSAEHFANSGDDSPPLKGDFAALDDAPGKGSQRTTGYVDSKNAGKALPGEKRIYARDADGVVVAELWMNVTEKVIDVQGLAPGWKYRLGKLEIDEDGNLTTPGEITAKAGTPQLVTLTQHIHPTGTGPSGPATPGQ